MKGIDITSTGVISFTFQTKIKMTKSTGKGPARLRVCKACASFELETGIVRFSGFSCESAGWCWVGGSMLETTTGVPAPTEMHARSVVGAQVIVDKLKQVGLLPRYYKLIQGL